jgi:hypothetical protein
MSRWILGAMGGAVVAVVLLASILARSPSDRAVLRSSPVSHVAPDSRTALVESADIPEAVDAGVAPARAKVADAGQGNAQRPIAPRVSNGERRTYSFRLDELQTHCWGDPAHPSRHYDDEPLDMFALRVPTRTAAATPFDFCIEEVRFGNARVIWGKDARVEGVPGLGLSGRWLPFSDEVTTWERPRGGRSFEGLTAGEPLCIKGTAPEVFEGHYGDYWGAAVGFVFQRMNGGSRPSPYRPHFTSIEVVLSGAEIPALLTFAVDRHAFGENNESWCKFAR